MRRCRLTCEDHENKPRDHRRSHCAYRRNHSSSNWLNQGVGWSFDLQCLLGRATSIGFQESSYSWRQKSKNAQKMINLHCSYQSIKGLYFISLFSPNQSYHKFIITSIINMSRTRQLVRLSSHQCNFDLGRICVCTPRIHLYPDHVQWKGKRNRKCDMVIIWAVIGGGWEGEGGGGDTNTNRTGMLIRNCE